MAKRQAKQQILNTTGRSKALRLAARSVAGGVAGVAAGMAALLLMLPLALTSTNWAIRKMGGKRWQALHRLSYLAGIAGVTHYLWQGKSINYDPLIYALLLAVLLGARVVFYFRKRARTMTAAG